MTVLFADLAGSTALGDEMDPEALRQLMTRYFQEMGTVLRSYGGTIEKFIGDAIMAVFGVPRLHEDDAPAPANAPGIRHILFVVDDAQASLAGLQAHGGELVGELVNYENSYWLCYVRGPAGIIVELAEKIS